MPLFPQGSPPNPRFCHSFVLCGESRVVVFGGFDSINRRSDLYEVNIDAIKFG